MKKSFFLGSLLLAAGIAITAVYGLFVPGAYSGETANWAAQARGQDWADLLLAVPLLLVSAFFALRKSVPAFLVWLGTLFFTVYSFLLYAFMVHFNAMFPLYMAVLGFSIYILIFSLTQSKGLWEGISHSENWSRKGSAILLLVTGILFYVIWAKDIFSSLLAGTLPASIVETGLPTNGVYVIDTAICLPALLIGGWRLLKRKKSGFALGGGLLVFSALMSANITLLMGYMDAEGFAVQRPLLFVFGAFTLLNFVFAAAYLKNIRTVSKTAESDLITDRRG
jgi:hypothetical protein